jgi:hypothetical protein
MERIRARFSTLILFATLCSGSLTASADWEGKFMAISSKNEFPKISGKIYARPDRLRVDSPYPFEMSVYVKNGEDRAYAAVHSFRIRLSSKPASLSGQLPACLAKSFDSCVTSLKLKKVTSEKCGLANCDVYEGSPKTKGIKSVKVWHRSGEKEAILAKSIVAKTDGSTITTVFEDIVKSNRPDTFFVVPANYKDAGSLERFFGDLQGKSDP